MTSSSEHWEVAPYVLGLLDAQEAARFEDHLVACDRCAEELESFLPVSTLLAKATPADLGLEADTLLPAARHRAEPGDRAIITVLHQHRRPRPRRQVILAAAAATVLLLLGLSFVFGRVSAPNTPGTVAQPPATEQQAQLQAPSTADAGSGIGGPEESGERFEATDPVTGVRALVVLNAQSWGTEVSLSLANITGPLVQCQLVTFDVEGVVDIVATWSVPADGYGTAAHPAPLMLQSATSRQPTQLDRFEIRSLSPTGLAATLVTIRV